MLYNLIKKYKGKETVMMTDSLAKVNARKKELSSSQRGGIKNQRVEYVVVPTTETDKFKKKPVKYFGSY